MTSDKFVDLDAVLAERQDQATPLTVRLFGQEWDLPGFLPAAVTLRLLRWSEAGWIDDQYGVSDDVGPLDQMALLADIVPSEVMDVWCAKGLDTMGLIPVIESIMGAYQDHAEARAGEAGAEGEAKPPKGGSRSTKSSNGGARSKRTSTANTRSRTSGKR